MKINKLSDNLVYQFRIELSEIEPTIWRVIQVPSGYTFWDLHVAIQDSMGWLDYHLHAFRVRMPNKKKETEIGIPDKESYDHLVLPGWEVLVKDYFTDPGKFAIYDYDFGDKWSHHVLLESILMKDSHAKYPICIAGERACPPEDCGGVPGYYQLIEILNDPNHSEYNDNIEWLKGHAKNYYPYEADKFNPDYVESGTQKKDGKWPFHLRYTKNNHKILIEYHKSTSFVMKNHAV